MNKKTTIIAISFLMAGLILGIGIAYFIKVASREAKPSSDTTGRAALDLAPRAKTAYSREIVYLFNCPCGNCSDRLIYCRCPTAKKVITYLNSLIEKGISENEIRDRMVARYGVSIMSKDRPIPPYYNTVEGVELPTTLDPNTISEKAREAYEVARTYPELLLQMPCYCGCEKGRGKRKPHKSLLDCFTDKHGENCQICVLGALYARNRMKDGLKPEEIRQVIIEKRGRVRPS